MALARPRTTLFVDAFTVLDYAYLDPQQGVRGDSLHVSAQLTGELDAQGFILDFGRTKKLLKRVVDDTLDHRCAVPTRSPALESVGANSSAPAAAVGFRYRAEGAVIEYACPAEALALVDAETIDEATLARFLEARLAEVLPANVHGVRITLAPEPRCSTEASFRYTHGLKHHDGNCQRLLHGHRNVIEALWDGRRDAELEAFLAATFADAHFAHAGDVEDFEASGLVLGTRDAARPGFVSIRYRAAQGEFAARLPAARLIAFEVEPSIENMTRRAWELVRERFELDGARLVVRGYEGLQKGAQVGG